MLRGADHRAHLRAVLGMHKPVNATAAADSLPAPTDDSSDSEATNSSATFTDSTNDSSVSEVKEPLLEPAFGTWALDSCQACPRCLVIIRKESGCNNIECRCGASFCYGCGVCNSGSDQRACLCSSKGSSLPKLAHWLQVSGTLAC